MHKVTQISAEIVFGRNNLYQISDLLQVWSHGCFTAGWHLPRGGRCTACLPCTTHYTPQVSPAALGSWLALWVSLHSWIPSGCFFCALGPEFSLNLHCTGPTPCPRQAADVCNHCSGQPLRRPLGMWSRWRVFVCLFVKQTKTGSTEEMLEHMGLPSWQEWLDITLSHCSAPLSLAPAPAGAAFAVGHRSIFIFRTNKVT